MQNDLLEAKVVILGSQGVGKTSLVVRYVQRTFSPNCPSTIGASFMTTKLAVDNCKVRLQIWDTAGQERFRSMAPMYYRGANAAIIVYDITSRKSFDEIETWVQELRKNMAEDLSKYSSISHRIHDQANRWFYQSFILWEINLIFHQREGVYL
ncbi:hypothetical protein K7432_012601 [Basidiobolus ranarum]|uniref:Uncharacterized protein n=1 Tax=Basidiobolus ranarum TaxID=34480 RepID=A0ABR2WKK7_9FUNG